MDTDNVTKIVAVVVILIGLYYVFFIKRNESEHFDQLLITQPAGNQLDSQSAQQATSQADSQADSQAESQADSQATSQADSQSQAPDVATQNIAKRASGQNAQAALQTNNYVSDWEGLNGVSDTGGTTLEGAYGAPLDMKNDKNPLDSSKLLPTTDTSKNWFDDVEAVDVKNAHLINIYRPIGVNSLGQSNRNRSWDWRGNADVPNPQFTVSPWLQSSIQPDRSMKTLC